MKLLAVALWAPLLVLAAGNSNRNTTFVSSSPPSSQPKDAPQPAQTSDEDASFREFFPTYRAAFRRIIRDNCSDVLPYFLAEEEAEENGTEKPLPSFLKDERVELEGSFHFDSATHFLTECILQHTPEVIKSKMATSQVLLGLTPSLMSLLGPGVHQTGLVAVAGGHPLLAFLLALGSPTVSPIASADYTRDLQVISARQFVLPDFLLSYGPLAIVIEYILALASIANIVHITYQLFRGVVFSFSASTPWTIFTWTFTGIVIHSIGAAAVSLRIRLIARSDTDRSRMTGFLRNMHLLRRPMTLRIKTMPETFGFYLTSWVASVLTVSHILYGSMVLSSVVFISVEDGAILLIRLMASVVVCKAVIMYELSYLQGVVTAVDEVPRDIDPREMPLQSSLLTSHEPKGPSIHRDPWERM